MINRRLLDAATLRLRALEKGASLQLNLNFKNPYELGAHAKATGRDHQALATVSGLGQASLHGALAGAAMRGATGQGMLNTAYQVAKGGPSQFESNAKAFAERAHGYFYGPSGLGKGLDRAVHSRLSGASLNKSIKAGLGEVNWKRVSPNLGRGAYGGALAMTAAQLASNQLKYRTGRHLAKEAPRPMMDEEKTAGGPGSGVTYNNTARISERPRSPLVTLTRRRHITDTPPARQKVRVRLSEIGFVVQDKYVVGKLGDMLSDKKEAWKENPIDLLYDGEKYHVLDGHHRFLTALRKGAPSLLANVWERTQPAVSRALRAAETESGRIKKASLEASPITERRPRKRREKMKPLTDGERAGMMAGSLAGGLILGGAGSALALLKPNMSRTLGKQMRKGNQEGFHAIASGVMDHGWHPPDLSPLAALGMGSGIVLGALPPWVAAIKRRKAPNEAPPSGPDARLVGGGAGALLGGYGGLQLGRALQDKALADSMLTHIPYIPRMVKFRGSERKKKAFQDDLIQLRRRRLPRKGLLGGVAAGLLGGAALGSAHRDKKITMNAGKWPTEREFRDWK